jgi:trimethylamine--corrinoid protein Co-methyltransferase
MVAAMCGANLVHDIGYMECGLCACWEMIAAADEVIGLTKRFMKGIRVDDETLAVDVLDKVGPSGHFLAEEHILKHFKDEHWDPKLFDRTYYNVWENAGGLTLGEKSKHVIEKILKEHKVPELPQGVLQDMDNILEEAKKFMIK